MAKIALVTGGNGFIGSHLVGKLVDEGFKVYALHRKPGSHNPRFNQLIAEGKVVSVLGDVKDFDYSQLPEKPEYIFHVAGKVSVWGKLDDFMEINYNGTNRLLEYAKNIRPVCFTYFSSTAVYGYNGYVNLSEDAPKEPFKNPYSISKLATENLVKDYCTENKLNYLIVRPGNVYGEYDYTSAHEIYTRVKHGKMMMCAKGKYKSCFVYVKNLVDAVVYLAKDEKNYNTDYNLTDGHNETLFEMLDLIAKTFNVPAKFKNVPGWLSKVVATLVECFYKLFCIKKAPLITRFSVWQNCADYSFSIEKLLSTGFKPQYTMEQGIKNTVEWINKLEESEHENRCKK